MEIIKGDNRAIQIDVPTGILKPSVEFDFDGEQAGNIVVPTVTDGVATVPVPYGAVAKEGTLTVKLSFFADSEYYDTSYVYDVVTPYVPLSKVREITGFDAAKAVSLERNVRLIIDEICGQSFGYREKTLTIRGRASNELVLPERLVEFTEMTVPNYTDVVVTDGVLVQEDGWQLRRLWSGSNIYDTTIYTNPIRYPFSPYEGRYQDFIVYHIKGKWGYKNVPTAITEAAMMMLSDYSCADIAYRDRYLESMTAADWRIQIGSYAYARTGNVRADQLLADYIRTGWGVI